MGEHDCSQMTDPSLSDFDESYFFFVGEFGETQNANLKRGGLEDYLCGVSDATADYNAYR